MKSGKLKSQGLIYSRYCLAKTALQKHVSQLTRLVLRADPSSKGWAVELYVCVYEYVIKFW